MMFNSKSVLALMALSKIASASGVLEIVQQQQLVYVTQEVLEVVGCTSTVWVQPPPPSETPKVETPTVETSAVEVPSPTLEEVAPVVETVEPSPSPEPAAYTPVVAPVQENVSSSGGGNSGSGNAGKATFYDAGLGSCGETHSNEDLICALSKLTMSIGAGPNPNLNPRCGTKIRVMSASNPEGIIVTIVDTCPGCGGPNDLDLSPAAFNQLGDPLEGVISITWVEL